MQTRFDSFTYQDAQHNNVTATLTAQQIAAIAAVEIPLVVAPDPGNNNNGSATWTYNIADQAFDFLAAGETLTLTFMAQVDTNYAPYNTVVIRPFTITITGTNDAPTATASSGSLTEFSGSGPGNRHVSGTISFADADLSDRPVVGTIFNSFTYVDSVWEQYQFDFDR